MGSSPSARADYDETQVFTARLHGQEIRFVSKQGLPNWDGVSHAVQLLAEVIALQPGWRTLLLGCGHGALGVYLANQVLPGDIWMNDASFLAQALTAQTLQLNRVENARLVEGYSLPLSMEGVFDCVILILPKGRKLAQRRLLEAFNSLKIGGLLYLAGANKEGIQSVIRDAEALFGPATILGYKKGNRVARLLKNLRNGSSPPWSMEPGIARNTWFEVEGEVAGEFCRLASLPGIFSYERVDDGSALLLSLLELQPGDQVLDIGCGWGILGLSAARMGSRSVDLVDVDLLGIAAANENIRRLNLPAARALPSDITSAVRDQRYTLVVTNPPFHAGRAVDYAVARAFIAQAYQVLRPGGRLLLVANRFIRYETLMRDVYREVVLLAENKRYQVWCGWK